MISLKERSSEKEIMDDLQFQDPVVHTTIREIAFINRWLGGDVVTMRALDQLYQKKKSLFHSGEIRFADLGCGAGDMLKNMGRWAKKKDITAQLTGVDANPFIIRFASENCKGFPDIHLKTENVFSKEFAGSIYDVVNCTLFLHHFTKEELITLLSVLKKNTRIAVVINDLHRHPLAYYSIKWLTKIFSKSWMVKNDACLSVKRGFTKTELEEIIIKSGFTSFSVHWKWAFRFQGILYADIPQASSL